MNTTKEKGLCLESLATAQAKALKGTHLATKKTNKISQIIIQIQKKVNNYF